MELQQKVTSGCWQSSKVKESRKMQHNVIQPRVNRTIESWELGFREVSDKSKTTTNVLAILELGKMSELYTGLTEPAT